MTPGSRGESGGTSQRPLLEPAFVSELERLSELPKRGANGGTVHGGRRRAPTEARRGMAAAMARRVRRSPGDDAIGEETTVAPPARRSGGIRVSQLFRRLFKAQRSDLYLLIDSTESMEMVSEATGARKWDQACRLTAAIGVAARSRYERVHLLTLGQARGRRSPIFQSASVGEGDQRNRPLFATLQRQRPGGTGKFLSALDHWVRRAPSGGVCVVISDFMTPEWEQGVNLLFDSGLRVALLQVVDPQDLSGESTRPLTLRAIGENGDADETRPLVLDPMIAEGLRETMTRFCEELAERCADSGAGYYRITTDESFEKALIDSLRA